ncbi:cytochrome P450 [Punctularia strigosozonata HHB-11173 SS5]|uniref:cytochrome P450 n=1 Tax=Punctularia strigosozonata (strain HHB-11173) TaxID=741275 RepID=UPI0004416768|nr:cytochrome P450 [Punctularia strigosozonata HHB-11173 SS5]EIN07006.1 cytochrome P450 [Punctularia strigosozonata HHB-11173 SS5]
MFLQLTLLAVAVLVLFKGLRWLATKSPLRLVRGPPRASWRTGNLHQALDLDGWDWHQTACDEYGGVFSFWGMFGERRLYVFDPLALYHVLVKVTYPLSALVLGRGLLATYGKIVLRLYDGDRHKKQRKLMNPVFSTRNIKHMVTQFYSVCHKLCDALAFELSEDDKEIDVLAWMSRTAMVLIGEAGLGYSFDPLTEQRENRYANAVKAIVPAFASIAILRELLPWVTMLGIPTLFERMLPYIPIKRVQHIRNITATLDEASHEVYQSKKEAIQRGDDAIMHQLGQGKDIMSILLRANLKASDNDRLPEAEVIAQMSTLVFAATDTTTNALSRTLFLLSQNQDVQRRLRDEIVQAKAGRDGDLTYEELDTLPYLDAVVRETLRLHPPVPYVSRMATQDMTLPLAKPLKATDGSMLHHIAVPRGTKLVISFWAINRSTAYWGDDALEWKPERFLQPLPQTLIDAHIPGIYSSMMTFGGGGFSCIGSKFAQLEMKVSLSLLVERFALTMTKTEIRWNMAPIQASQTFRDRELI